MLNWYQNMYIRNTCNFIKIKCLYPKKVQNARSLYYNLFTFLLAAVEPLTNVLCNFPFCFSRYSPTIPKLSSWICSMVSDGYWHPRNSMLPNVFAKPTWNQLLINDYHIQHFKMRKKKTTTYQFCLWKSVFMMLHELFLQCPMMLWLMLRSVLFNVPVLWMCHISMM